MAMDQPIRKLGEENIDNLNLERQLDAEEAMMEYFSEPEAAKKLGGNLGLMMTVGQVFEIESDEPLTKDMVNRALHLLGQRHPLFRMRIVTQTDPNTGKKAKYYSEIAEEKVYATCQVVENDNWDDVFVTETTKLVPSDVGPLCRTLLLPSQAIDKAESEFGRCYKTIVLFLYRHTILDGNTVLRLFDDFLTYLAKSVDSNGISDLPQEERLPLLPQFAELVPPGELRMAFRDKWKLLVSGFLSLKGGKNPYSKKFGFAIDRDSDLLLTTRIYPMVIQPDLTEKILSACKQRNITVNSAVSAAAAIAVSKIIQGGTLHHSKSFETMFISNSRKFTRPEVGPLEEHIGCFIQNRMLQIKVSKNSEENFWKLAEKIGKDVWGNLTGRNALYTTRMQLYLANQLHINMGEKITKQLTAEDRPSFKFVYGMSNMGRCDFFQKEKPRPFELSATYSAGIGHGLGGTFYHNICTFNKKMFWSVVYYTPSTTREQAQEYAKVITQTLEKAVLIPVTA